MSSTEGLGNTLWNINLMEYITQMLTNKYTAKCKSVYENPRGIKKKTQ